MNKEDVNNIKEEHIENTEVSSNNYKEDYLKENNIDYNKGINNHELKSKDNDIEYVNNNFSELELEYKRILNIVGNYLSK